MSFLYLIAISVCTAVGFIGGMIICNFFKWKSVNGVLNEMRNISLTLKKVNKKLRSSRENK